ncbi:GGDEF domain-containing protein [Alcanivorax sp. JB21]|uniref:GGDEF domain-containing protein n=1 Tax=Alcanivorax limicola TaxID=2874102 RepID=UPI001CC1479F|nr:GGDEF domain-containing protein [Alcanivorax limicola]MBZ2189753.1 GGDEF domain-containing protein [Alcanivorax limicola]
MNLPSSLATDRGTNTLQLTARLLFTLLVIAYFTALPALQLPLHGALMALLIALYLLLQGGLFYRPFAGAPLIGNLIDLIALGVLVMLDPGEPPPTLALMIVAVLSTGLLNGLPRFLSSLGIAAVVLAVVLPLRLQQSDAPLAASSLFLLAVMLTCAVYFGLLLYRNKVLTRLAQESTWQDPQTGLISRTALSHTAGWLLPLHERLSSPLTAIMLRPHDPAQLDALAGGLSQRLRRSDIGARADDHCLALLLPDTNVANAERVITSLREHTPPFTAVMAAVPRETSLDLVIDHLGDTFRRGDTAERELIHAPPLRP